VVLGGWLDSILDIFSNLRFYNNMVDFRVSLNWILITCLEGIRETNES